MGRGPTARCCRAGHDVILLERFAAARPAGRIGAKASRCSALSLKDDAPTGGGA